MSMHAPITNLPIAFNEVSVVAGASKILDTVSLTVNAGAPTLLIGPNGAGKTTLLRVAMGLTVPSSGRITWADRDTPPARQAFLFQRPAMLRRSAAGNLRYALKVARIARDTHDRRIAELLALVGLEGVADTPARRLSGGEQQRLALARALARDPAVLFLDEPTASLDPAATKAVEEVIRAVAERGIKVVMSTHDLGEARRLAGDVVMLHRGRIVETSPAASFFAAPRSAEAKTFLAGELLL
jgi:tungstate transport system ATP-binding protein